MDDDTDAFLGSLFFAVAAVSRRLIVVYLQGVVLFGAYLISSIVILSSQRLNMFWPSVLDPLGIVLMQGVTKYWTVAERNNLFLPWSGEFLYNRLLWMGVGLVALALACLLFPTSAEVMANGRSWWRKRAVLEAAEEGPAIQIPSRLRRIAALQTFDAAASWAQLKSLTSIRFLNIVREPVFWAIALMMLINCGVNARNAGRIFTNTPVWPVTYLMTQVLTTAYLYLYIVATLYTGELVWRERDVHFDQIHDALPVRTWVNWMSQFVSIAAVEFLLITSVIACGIAMQAWSGYYRFEMPLYVKELYLIAFPSVVTFVLFAFFCHTLVSNKFVAHGMVIGTFLIVPVLYRYGIENRLVLFGEITPYTYSDMNGYGHFVPGLATSIVYWLSVACLLGVASIAWARRGTDLGWARRGRAGFACARTPGMVAAFILPAIVCAGSGGWFYYNAHVLNQYRTSAMNRSDQAAYERAYKKYERLPQPKITGVETVVNIYPQTRSFDGTAEYVLVNHTGQPVPAIHVTVPSRDIEEQVNLDRPFRTELDDRRLGYRILRLSQPLMPGEPVRIRARAEIHTRGFRDGGSMSQLAYNGTFFDRDVFPVIGYDQGRELDDPVRRREEKLPEMEELPLPGDPYSTNLNLFTPDSDWITYRAVVSTSADQIAIAPGYLKREWTDKGRRYFEYDMGSTRINNFYSFVSGRYAVRRDKWKNVNLEIYYHPGHEYNLDRMLQSAKKGLDYFEKNFGPYQFTQFRILEFPRYRGFAQSFPNTVPYSEGLGIIQRVEKEDDIDETFYITAHELAHQWWGHQLIGSRTQGSNMMSESLAQYSALMLMEKEYGPDNVRKFLKYELDGYLRGRTGERRKEPPLTRVQRENYVWYQKGSLAMYALRDYLGEETLNRALRTFLERHKFATGPFPNTDEFVACLREFTPADKQYLITDLLESIVLFDNKAVAATWSRLPDGKYKIALTIETKKMKADGSGNETAIAMNDLVDIGVFTGEGDRQKPLYLAKHRLTAGHSTLEIVVGSEPSRAGVDPYNKLIDRKPDDNVMAVSKL